MLKKQILLLCLISYVHFSTSNIDVILTIGKKMWKVVDLLNNANTANDFTMKVKALIDGEAAEHQEVMAELSKLSEQTKDFRNYVEGQFGIVKELIKELPNEVQDEKDRRDLYGYLDYINTAHNELQDHIKFNPPQSVWKQFAKKVRERGGIEDVMGKVRMLVAPYNSDPRSPAGGLLQKIAYQGLISEKELCGGGQTMQQLLERVIERVLLAEIQTLTILSMTSRFIHDTTEASHSAILLHRKQFEDRYLEYLRAGINAMKTAPESMRACDPPRWDKDKNYFEIEWLGQPSLHQLKEWDGKLRCGGEKDNSWVSKYECKGNLHGCVEAQAIEVCRAGDPEGLHPFHWIKFGDKNLGSHVDWCPGDETKSSSFWSKLNFASYCLCNCMRDDKESISLSLVQSNVAENKVITGVRFVRQNRVLYIQIREGELLPNGQIKKANSSDGWVPLPKNPETIYLHTLQRTFVLSNLTVPSGYALVGIQFVRHPERDLPIPEYADHENPNPLSLRVIGQKLDHLKGKLVPGRTTISTEITPEYKFLMDSGRKSIDVSNAKHKPVSGKRYVSLANSAFEYDVAQSVLPLFDGVEVVTDPPTPLGGVGLFLKTIDGDYSGLLSLRLYSLPHRVYLEEKLGNYKSGRVLDNCTQPSCSFDNILDLGEKVYHFMKSVTEVYDVINDKVVHTEDSKLARIFSNDDAKPPATMEFIDIKERLDSPNYYKKVDDLVVLLDKTITYLVTRGGSTAMRELFQKYITPIDEKFNKLSNYSGGLRDSNAKSWLNDTKVIRDNINKLHQFLLHSYGNSEAGGFIEEISHRSKPFVEKNCMRAVSVPEILAHILRTTIATEAKAMVVMSLSTRVRNETAAWRDDILARRESFKQRFLSYVQGFKDALHSAAEDIRFCHAVTKDRFGQFSMAHNVMHETPTSISLAAFHADVSKNKVISSVKFVIRDGVLFLQPLQHKLLPNGLLDREFGNELPLPDDPKKIDIDMKHRKLFFGDVNFLPEYAIVGLQFAQNDDGFFLKVTAQQFDFSSGKLLSKEFKLSTDHKWHEDINSMQLHEMHEHPPYDLESNRTFIELDLPDPLQNSGPTALFESMSSFVFPSAPLGGIGYFYRSLRNNTGLITPRVFTPRYEDNLINFIEKNKRKHAFVDY